MQGAPRDEGDPRWQANSLSLAKIGELKFGPGVIGVYDRRSVLLDGTTEHCLGSVHDRREIIGELGRLWSTSGLAKSRFEHKHFGNGDIPADRSRSDEERRRKECRAFRWRCKSLQVTPLAAVRMLASRWHRRLQQQ
jgi:hypothetical protein